MTTATPPSRPRVLAFGDNTSDFFTDRGIAYPGGNCVNFAAFTARLGLSASYLGPFGSDQRAQHIQASLVAEGVMLSPYCTTRTGATGLAEMRLENGDIVGRGLNGGGVGSSRPIRLTEEITAYVGEFDLVHSSVYSRIEPSLPTLAAGRSLVAFDFSSEQLYRTDAYLQSVAPYVDWAQFSGSGLSESDAVALATRAQEHYGPAVVVVTRGLKGVVARCGGHVVTVPATALADDDDFVDPLGCGDALIASAVASALRSGWRKGAELDPEVLRDALITASSVSAQQCLTPGGFGHGQVLDFERELSAL